MKYLIIGGVAGGATAAARIRRIDESAEIVMVEKGPYISYANCGLPYYIGGTIQERSRLFLQTPQSFSKRFKIDVRIREEAVRIDVERKCVQIKKNDQSVYEETFDKLLLSPGSSPVKPPLPGIDAPNIFTLRNVEDTDNIKKYITTHRVNKAVVVGAGFIGLEMAENLAQTGAQVNIIEMANQVMAPIDFSMASLVHQHLIEKGIGLYLEKAVSAFNHASDTTEVILSSGERMEADLVILSIGVRPETQLAKTADIKIGETGGIWVDQYLQTSIPDIYAVGDAIEYPHPLTGLPWLNYLANPANRQGRLVADNMVLGHRQAYEGAIGTSIAKVFDMTVASTGLAAKKLKSLHIPYLSSFTHGSSHAGYYPNALPISTKLIFAPETRKILGAQIVGYDGVDKRIDQIALLIKKGGTIEDLMHIEHAYAPPYSSAKDPIAIAGYVAHNVLTGVMPVVYWKDIANINTNEAVLLDVRTKEEYSMGHIPNSINIPVDNLREQLNTLPREKPIYVYCAVGLRGYLACQILKGNGYKNIFNLSGGYKTYSAATAPISTHITPMTTKGPDASSDDLNTKSHKTLRVDACGLQCPGPIMKMKSSIDMIEEGDRIEMKSTDAGFMRDIQAWCNITGHQLLQKDSDKGVYSVTIEKGGTKQCHVVSSCDSKGKTLIVFSDDLDKVLASFVLANGAAATGEKVTMFFTFWGLNAIKRIHKPKVQKDIFGRMFSMMLPSNSYKLKLSKMNMGGVGTRMMRFIMKKKGIDSLEELRRQALENGVEFIACQMSMDVMGVNAEELLDGVTIGGVATYMERAEQANVNLFI